MLGHADVVLPDRMGLVVGVVDRDPESLAVELQHACEEFPGPGDRLALEVVAERPVAEHLEERVVARGVADRIEVVVLAARAQAALHVRRTHVRQLFAAEEHVLERHHAGVGEQQGRVVGGHQRARRHDRMVLGAEELQERGADFGGFHGRRIGTDSGSGHAEGAARFASHPSNSSPVPSTSARVTARTVAGSKPRRKRKPARAARSAASTLPRPPWRRRN